MEAERTPVPTVTYRLAAFLHIIRSSVPILAAGLTRSAALELACLFYLGLPFDSVWITDNRKVLAVEGRDRNYHRTGNPIVAPLMQKTLHRGHSEILVCRADFACSRSKCSLGSAVASPLLLRGEVIGSLVLARSAEYAIEAKDVALADCLTDLICSRIELSDLRRLRSIANGAESALLQGQMQPHFLFNVLNSISAACVCDPMLAREMIGRLSSLLRAAPRTGTSLVPLDTELQLVKDYVSIESMRFPERISLYLDITTEALSAHVPLFLLQPLVENSIKYGLCNPTVSIEVRCTVQNSYLEIQVLDDGPGMAQSHILLIHQEQYYGMGLGLTCTRRRLRLLFGRQAFLQISPQNPGIAVSIRIPIVESARARTMMYANGKI